MLKKLLISAALAAAAAAALAVPVTTIWSVSKNEGVFLFDGLTRYFDLDLKLSGFRPGVDEPAWGNYADLTLDFLDDYDPSSVGYNEVFGVAVASTSTDWRFVGGYNLYDGGSFDFGLTSDALAGINDNGVLRVAVTGFGGDFWLTSAKLSAYGYTDLATVPEGGLYRASYVPLGGLISCWNGTEFVSVPGITLDCPGADLASQDPPAVTPVLPEPGSLALLGSALLGVGIVHRRRQIARAASVFATNLKGKLS